jgi:hypothetical protein
MFCPATDAFQAIAIGTRARPPRSFRDTDVAGVKGNGLLTMEKILAFKLDAHHLRFAQSRALGRKVSDEFIVPLCQGRAGVRATGHAIGDKSEHWAGRHSVAPYGMGAN